MLVTDARVVRRDRQVAREHQLQTTGQREATQHRDGDDGRFLDGEQQVVEIPDEVEVPRMVLEHLVEVLQVGPHREGPIPASENQNAHRWVLDRLCHRGSDPVHHRRIHRVEDLRTVQRQPADALVRVVPHACA